MLGLSLWTLVALYLYVIGGVVAGRAEYAKSGDKMRAISAAAAWPAVPSKWLFGFIRAMFD